MIRILILLALVLCPAALAEETALVSDGKSPYVIVIAEKPMPANVRAAHELQSHLKQMSGVELAIKSDAEPIDKNSILVGPSKAVDALGVKLDKEKLGNDGFALKTVGGQIVIAGPGPRGSMYGVSEFLEKLG